MCIVLLTAAGDQISNAVLAYNVAAYKHRIGSNIYNTPLSRGDFEPVTIHL